MVKIDGLDQTDAIDKYIDVADEIERTMTNMIFTPKFKVVN